jgi:putative PIN family toxin of toxin-antitoxin system
MTLIVIDANVWIRYARTKNIAPLLDRFSKYHFIPVVNNYMLSEIFITLAKNKWLNIHETKKVTDFIRSISLVTTERAIYRISPDAEDNYLFDLAIQNNCDFIISNDRELLNFIMRPVPVYSGKWFLNRFPVK